MYLDTCCYNRPFDKQASLRIALETQAKLYIQQLIRYSELELATSYMLLYEVGQNPFIIRQFLIEDFLNQYSSIHIGPEYASKIQCEAQSVISTGIKPKDAYHVMCAIEADCRFFLSTDDRLLKFQTNKLQLMNPVDFVLKEVGDYEPHHE